MYKWPLYRIPITQYPLSKALTALASDWWNRPNYVKYFRRASNQLNPLTTTIITASRKVRDRRICENNQWKRARKKKLRGKNERKQEKERRDKENERKVMRASSEEWKGSRSAANKACATIESVIAYYEKRRLSLRGRLKPFNSQIWRTYDAIEFGPVPSIVDSGQKPIERTQGCCQIDTRVGLVQKFAFNREQILCHFSLLQEWPE